MASHRKNTFSVKSKAFIPGHPVILDVPAATEPEGVFGASLCTAKPTRPPRGGADLETRLQAGQPGAGVLLPRQLQDTSSINRTVSRVSG